ncbi:Panacea domain-containing protein [Longimicrobium sp.]|uniref:Panacea domain-containing protein n=1 Tax=Longimicrobium sp. TaxID=2029185 RepID=UPI002CE379AA|nr:type II toxin-antitoxin system antitoxin SocA domain-containing protein [Longimicrobium sp.]HSU15747.1 type II toxin-antitoxin system antitoxin SocA domain-containing protein [Longimicrobium sp.]
MTSADAVADYLIALAHQRGEPVNNLKLQALLYYAQAWHLALHDEPLFPEKFQAWMTGPAIPRLYWKFKPFGIRDIALGAAPEIPAALEPLLRNVVEQYGSLDEYQLGSMTHRESPWASAHHGFDLADPCEVELDEAEMREYFRQLAEAA